MPFVIAFVDESSALVFKELVHEFKLLALSRDESGAAEQVGVLRHAIGLSKSAAISKSLLLGDALWKSRSVTPGAMELGSRANSPSRGSRQC